jgi:hypothetical protein
LALRVGLYAACSDDDLPASSGGVLSLFQHLRHQNVRLTTTTRKSTGTSFV